ncbi:MAG: DUF86 domain-containing protein [Bacteroidales bacterium]|nr:DUF86 domain-containing protein [Bacteroidales bacterium]
MPKQLQHKDSLCLLNILDAIQKVTDYTKDIKSADDFFKNTQTFDASLMNFVVIGEMVGKLSDSVVDETSNDVNWFRIKGFRNILAHNYFGIDAEEVWEIIQEHLPILKTKIEQIIETK